MKHITITKEKKPWNQTFYNLYNRREWIGTVYLSSHKVWVAQPANLLYSCSCSNFRKALRAVVYVTTQPKDIRLIDMQSKKVFA